MKTKLIPIMTKLLSLLLMPLALFLSSCATADFTPYAGAQQNWPTARGAFVATQYAVPVFFGAPNRPYDVIGYLKAETDAFRNTQGHVIDFMARRAREVGGNGLIVVGVGSHYLGSVSSGSVYGNVYGQGFTATSYATSTPMFGGNGDAVVIRLL
jgi:hypothetical protein